MKWAVSSLYAKLTLCSYTRECWTGPLNDPLNAASDLKALFETERGFCCQEEVCVYLQLLLSKHHIEKKAEQFLNSTNIFLKKYYKSFFTGV